MSGQADSESPLLGLSNRVKWGDALDAGFQVVPDVLIRHQLRLGLTPLDVLILLNVLLHWWTAAELPFPRLTTVAARIGVSARTVERRVAAMEGRGLITRRSAEPGPDGSISVRRFDLSGLVAELQTLARSDQAFTARKAKRPSTTNEKRGRLPRATPVFSEVPNH